MPGPPPPPPDGGDKPGVWVTADISAMSATEVTELQNHWKSEGYFFMWANDRFLNFYKVTH